MSKSCEGKNTKYTITPKGALFEKYGDVTAGEIMDLLELTALRRCSNEAGAVPAIIFDCYHGSFGQVFNNPGKPNKKKAKRK